jgi:phage shock protein PspC (stress-responsive transcriptional regulator)
MPTDPSARPAEPAPIFGGVCARLAVATDTPVWLWRVGFILAVQGGLLLYLALWLILSHQQLKDVLNRLHRATVGGWIAGVCRGLADATDTPVWAWRIGFVLGLHAGILIYLLLWVFMPKSAGGGSWAD